jgi:hypothetical protein
MGHIISHHGLKLEIKLEEIKKLYVHEEIIPRIVKLLSREINQGIYRDPVIVDKETLVVLDGMHRVAALQHLDCKLIPVCLVNYDNPSIRVESWFRTIENGQKTGESVREDLEKAGYNLKEIAENDLKRKLHEREIMIGIVTSSKCYYVSKKIESIKEIYEYIKQIEKNLASVGYTIGYKTESDALNEVKSDRALTAIIARRITKSEVITTALSGETFVYKSTRHVIPARPLFVNVPIEWLNMDSKEANKLLLEHLSKKKLRRLQAEQTLDRRYKEKLYVFSDT